MDQKFDHGHIDSFSLKILAIVSMTCNHAAYIFEGDLPFWLFCICIGIGGLTFPIMAYLVLIGYHHTHSVRNYALRLLSFAVISELPFWFFLGHDGNVLFTLLAGLLIFWLDDIMENRIVFTICCLSLISVTIFCDWGIVGPFLMYLFKYHEDTSHPIWVPLFVTCLINGIGPLMALSGSGSMDSLPFVLYALSNVLSGYFLTRYNGERGYPLKYFFYGYYPLHILVLGSLSML